MVVWVVGRDTYMLSSGHEVNQIVAQKHWFAAFSRASDEHEVGGLNVLRVDILEWEHEATQILAVHPVFDQWPFKGTGTFALILNCYFSWFYFCWYHDAFLRCEFGSQITVHLTVFTCLKWLSFQDLWKCSKCILIRSSQESLCKCLTPPLQSFEDIDPASPREDVWKEPKHVPV